jgi:PAS domain S-box-containing protein/putative nucleotidyltransferase with HDIG domain
MPEHELTDEFLKSFIQLREDLIKLEKLEDRTKYIRKIIKQNQLFQSSLLNNLPGMLYYCRNDLKWTMEFVNHGFFPLTGYKAEDVLLNNKISYEDIIHPDDRETVREKVNKAIEKSKQFYLEYRITTASGKIKWVSEVGKVITLEPHNMQLLGGFIIDVTDRKQAEEYSNENTEKYRILFNTSPVGIVLLDMRGYITACNATVENYTGYSINELIGKHFTKLKTLKVNNIPYYIGLFTQVLRGKKITNQLISWKNKNGGIFTGGIQTSIIKKNKKTAGVQITITDWTNQIKTEKELRDSEKFSKNILKNSPSPIIIINPDTSIRYANPAFEKITGFTSDELIGQLPPYPFWIKEKGLFYAEKLKDGFSMGLSTEEFQFINKNGKKFWVQITSLPVKENRRLLYLIVNFIDITERKKSFNDLKKILDDTINALASIVEARDPYTAGHQKKVSELSVKIAEKLNLSEDKIEVIRTAALIHDIGKIVIPASILSKPGTLSALEFEMIKTHVQVGFDIIKKIEFHLPIAKIVSQHHEREDGSGYPNGLKGDEITLEAKIIGIADVVVAISSHRPYRPALDRKYAIEEINGNSGKLYNHKVVIACMEVINKDKFSFN